MRVCFCARSRARACMRVWNFYPRAYARPMRPLCSCARCEGCVSARSPACAGRARIRGCAQGLPAQESARARLDPRRYGAHHGPAARRAHHPGP